jgi:hypothetical protein
MRFTSNRSKISKIGEIWAKDQSRVHRKPLI